MDVSPMSLQMVFPRATEAGQVQHNLNQAAALQQEKDAELKQKQVRTKDDTEGGRIKDDPDRQRGQGGYAGNPNRNAAMMDEEAEKEQFAVDPSRGHHLDISF